VSFLGPTDPLALRPRRVLVAGVAGAGKTTLAGRIGASLGIPHIEIDALFHGPNWTPRPEFRADVEAFSSAAEWVTEWQYSMVRPLLLTRCDLLVWLDLPVPQALAQVTLRTLRRRMSGTPLWNGNVEPPLRAFFTDREHIVRWAWDTRHKARRLVYAARTERRDLPIVRLTSHRQSRRWLTEVLAPAREV